MSEAVGAVILAAGSSSRLGRLKQVVRWRGESLLRRAVLAAQGAGCRPVIAVLGAHGELTRKELAGLEVRTVANTDWPSGMASSIRAGIQALAACEPPVATAVLMVCDQPHTNAEVISRLIATYRTTGQPLIGSAYGGSFGVPALFGRALFTELSVLTGAGGAKQVMERHAANARFLPFPGGDVDVDTADDLARLTHAHADEGMLLSLAADRS